MILIEHADWTVDERSKGMRLDRFLTERAPATTRTLAAEAIAEGAVQVNGAPQPKAYRLLPGERVTVARLLEFRDVVVRPNPGIDIEVVFEDAHLFALNKPAGLAVHPLHHTETNTLANGLVARFAGLETLVGDNPLFPAMAHRIDTGTSGLVLAARTREAYGALRGLFNAREVGKDYLAIVHGRVAGPLDLSHYLAHDAKRRGRMRIVDGPAGDEPEPRYLAESHVRPLRRGPQHSLVNVFIRTGITHQIRCQLAGAGHPVVGDRVYGPPETTESRHFLHAWRLEFVHPKTGKPLTIEAPPPPEFEAAARRLTAPAAG